MVQHTTHTILVVEEESIDRSTLRRLLERHDYQVSEAASVSEAENKYTLADFDLIISDLRLPGMPGTELIKRAAGVPVLILTRYASLRSAVDTMRMGAVDYIARPFEQNDMLAAVTRAIDLHRADGAAGAAAAVTDFIADSPVMVALLEQLRKIAPSDASVLILGETGTGKEWVARLLHYHSRRRDQPLIAINCAALPAAGLEATLFGSEKGAAGADASHCGLLEAADGGTLLLDEIGELPLAAQARLLRFIQDGELRRDGSTAARQVDVRLLCTSHCDLRQLINDGRFRQDLHYRIDVMRLQLPPLRDRGKDIPALAEHSLNQCCSQSGKQPLRFSARAIQAITRYTWPGNVRELQNAVERAVILCTDDEIDNALLGIELEPAQLSRLRERKSGSAALARVNNSDPPEDLSLEEYFQRFVLEHQDSMGETELAKKLGISRKCLWERRQRFDIPRQKADKHSARG